MRGTDASSGWFVLELCHMLLTLSLKMKILRLVFLNGKRRNSVTESLRSCHLSEGNGASLVSLTPKNAAPDAHINLFKHIKCMFD